MSLLGSGNYLWSPYVEARQPLQIHPLSPLTLVTPPSGMAVSLDDVKDFVRVDRSDHSSDDLIGRFIREATELAQKLIPGWRQLLRATWSVQLTHWWSRAIRMPLPPLFAVDFIKYRDQGGVLQTLDPSFYQVRVYQRAPGEIDRAPFQNWASPVWPIVQLRERWPITIQFQAGYPDGMVPETIKGAIIWRAGYEYDIRVPCNTKIDPDEVMEKKLYPDFWGSYSGES